MTNYTRTYKPRKLGFSIGRVIGFLILVAAAVSILAITALAVLTIVAVVSVVVL